MLASIIVVLLIEGTVQYCSFCVCCHYTIKYFLTSFLNAFSVANYMAETVDSCLRNDSRLWLV